MITKVSYSLYRGPRPDLTDPLTVNQFKTLGIGQVLNLEVGYFEWFHHESGQEQGLVEGMGIPYNHIPLSDISAPTPNEIERSLWYFSNGVEEKRITYVHCLHGQDRTGFVCAAYRVKVQGWSIEDAIHEMFLFGFHRFPYGCLGWVNALRDYLK